MKKSQIENLDKEASLLSESLESDPYSLFIFALNSPETKVKYISRLQKFFDFVGMQGNTIQEQSSIFVKNSTNNNKYALNSIIKFLQMQKERVEKKDITGATGSKLCEDHEIILRNE